jgi:hypothetical protein
LIVSVLALLQDGAAASGADRDAKFAAMLRATKLEGQFTVDAPQAPQLPQQDLYMVSEVVPGEQEGTLVFKARMSYGDRMNVELPIPVRLVWAADTPMLVMDRQTIAGVGTFTVRLLFFEGRYAGTWSSGPVGGHMWGTWVAEGSAPPPATPPGN